MKKESIYNIESVKYDCEESIYVATCILRDLRCGKFESSDYWDLKHMVSHLGGVLRELGYLSEEEE